MPEKEGKGKAGLFFSCLLKLGSEVLFGLWETLAGTAVDELARSSTPPFVGPLGVERGIRDRHAGQNLLTPGKELLLQIRNLAFSLCGQVLGFA